MFNKISDFLWEVPTSYRSDMNVPARIFASEKMLESIKNDRSIEQIINVTTLLGIVDAAYGMPDIHQGYGFPIGGVAATIYPDGAISPGGIGYDINCGVRLLTSSLQKKDIFDQKELLAQALFKTIPAGVGIGSDMKLTKQEFDQILEKGVPKLIADGYGTTQDLDNIESGGKLSQADPVQVSKRAKTRGIVQLGTLGAGNHFIEIGFVEKIYNKQIASKFNLFENQITVMIHTGSRGFGHQVASDAISIMQKAGDKYHINIPDQQLACVPFSSPEGQKYFSAMAAAANFAWCNRQLITYRVRNVWKKIFPNVSGLEILYDVAHNIAKIETHLIDKKETKLIVHRKGATRAFGPKRKALHKKFQETGQPVIVPGSMGTASYVLSGLHLLNKYHAFSSTCHGAGRAMSRHQAKRKIDGRTLSQNLKKDGILIKTKSIRDLPEEGPYAYKDIDLVIETVDKSQLAKKTARLKPLIVIKG